MWDDNDQEFHVGPEILKVEIEDVYLIIGFSKRGSKIMLIGHRGINLST